MGLLYYQRYYINAIGVVLTPEPDFRNNHPFDEHRDHSSVRKVLFVMFYIWMVVDENRKAWTTAGGDSTPTNLSVGPDVHDHQTLPVILDHQASPRSPSRIALQSQSSAALLGKVASKISKHFAQSIQFLPRRHRVSQLRFEIARMAPCHLAENRVL